MESRFFIMRCSEGLSCSGVLRILGMAGMASLVFSGLFLDAPQSFLSFPKKPVGSTAVRTGVLVMAFFLY